MSKHDDQVSLNDMLSHAREAVVLILVEIGRMRTSNSRWSAAGSGTDLLLGKAVPEPLLADWPKCDRQSA